MISKGKSPRTNTPSLWHNSSKDFPNFLNTTEFTHSGAKLSGITTFYLDSECKNKAISIAISGLKDSGKI